MKNKIRNYKDIEPEILSALKEKLPMSGVQEKDLSVVGITMVSLQNELTGITVGGRIIPTVVVVGNQSGRVYQFALRALMPDLDVEL